MKKTAPSRRSTKTARFMLDLYVSGQTPLSRLAIDNISRFCKEHLTGHYRLAVIDVQRHPTTAQAEQVVAVPLLIKRSPLPRQRMIGDMSNFGRVLVKLGLGSSEIHN